MIPCFMLTTSQTTDVWNRPKDIRMVQVLSLVITAIIFNCAQIKLFMKMLKPH